MGPLSLKNRKPDPLGSSDFFRNKFRIVSGIGHSAAGSQRLLRGATRAFRPAVAQWPYRLGYQALAHIVFREAGIDSSSIGMARSWFNKKNDWILAPSLFRLGSKSEGIRNSFMLYLRHAFSACAR